MVKFRWIKDSTVEQTVISYTDLKEVTPIVAGIVIHKENPTGYSFDSNAGYIAYADSTQNPRNNNGVIYVGAVFPASLNAAFVLPATCRPEGFLSAKKANTLVMVQPNEEKNFSINRFKININFYILM